MFKSQLSAHRPKEQLTLNNDPKTYVNEQIAQYLLAHQINGIRCLYRNFKKAKSCVLNDEGGAGKCFQCVAFFDAILRASKSTKILIVCQQKSSLKHWQYHIDCFLQNVSVKVADSESDSQIYKPPESITIASLDYVLNHLTPFIRHNYDCVVFQDQQLQTSADIFAQLKQITSKCKIILCSNDLIENLSYFYEVLKFGDQTGPLIQGNGTLNVDEFKVKFGCNDKSLSKRNMAFRQSNLLNACSDFYLRRLCNQCGSQFPPINSQDFQTDFEAWMTHMVDTVPNEVNENSLPLELGPSPNNQTIASVTNDDSVSLLNTACAEFNEFDTQMSPLIYSDSEGSTNGDDGTFGQIQDSQHDDSQRIMTPEIACNQEHAAKTRTRTRKASLNNSTTHTTPIKRILRSNHDRISPACKRLNYKQLPIKINLNRKTDIKSKTYLFRTKKHPLINSTVFFQGESQVAGPSCHPSTSNTSDVQVISQAELSPIVISTSDDERYDGPKEDDTVKETQFQSELRFPSPDLFNSFSSAQSDVLSQKVISTPNNQIDNNDQRDKETDMFREVFGAPDECDDIDLLSNTNVDIFEITKNNVFDNVLCSADDKITPIKKSVKSTPKKLSQTISCLSGLRVVLPRLNGQQLEKIQNDLLSQSQLASTVHSLDDDDDDDVIDLTANDTQKIIEINSDESVRNREITPERKQELTPSTRSCLKRNPEHRSFTDERRKKSPYSRLGWLTTSRSSTKDGTPQSRRRLERWRKRTSEANLDADDATRTTRPRNLFQEFKSKTRQKSRYDIPSTSTAQSPNIFSDPE